MNKESYKQALLIYALIVFLAAMRLLPHPVNFAPIGALGLFSGAMLQNRYAWAIPVIALLLGDIIIGFYEPLVMLSVYGSFIICAVLGRYVLAENSRPVRLFGSAIACSAIFFVLSNLAVWGSGVLYERTANGLLECFLMAIPFFQNTLLGDLFYTFLIFTVCSMLQGKPVLKQSEQVS